MPRRERTPDRLPVKNSSRLVYDITGRGFTQFRGSVDVDNARAEVGSTLNPQLRFFIFGAEPNMNRLLPPFPGVPLPGPATVSSPRDVVDHVFWSALGRAPSPAERQLSEAAIANPPCRDRSLPTRWPTSSGPS